MAYEYVGPKRRQKCHATSKHAELATQDQKNKVVCQLACTNDDDCTVNKWEARLSDEKKKDPNTWEKYTRQLLSNYRICSKRYGYSDTYGHGYCTHFGPKPTHHFKAYRESCQIPRQCIPFRDENGKGSDLTGRCNGTCLPHGNW